MIHALLVAVALGTATASAAEPTYTECTLVNPSLTVNGEKIAMGRGFVATVGERTLFVTSHQVLGPAGGRDKQLSAKEAQAGFTQLVARDVFTSKECGRAKRMLAIEGAAMDLGAHGRDDVAAFLVDKSLDNKFSTAVKPLSLADSAPAKGDTVWLATRTSTKGRLVPAKIAEVNDNFVFYDFPEVKADDLMGSVGGPMLDAQGKVVGLHVGIGQLADGTLFGAANPVSSLKKHLAAELLPEKAAE